MAWLYFIAAVCSATFLKSLFDELLYGYFITSEASYGTPDNLVIDLNILKPYSNHLNGLKWYSSSH